MSPKRLQAALRWAEATRHVRYVYVMAGEGRTVKIGYTAHPEQRLSCMRSHSGRKLRITYLQECVSEKQARRIELAAHALLVKHRVHGEWFKITAAQAKTAILAADKFTR